MEVFRGESTAVACEDERFMRLALETARSAGDAGELPVGAVIARGGEAVALAANRTEADGAATSHAELNAIAAACRALGRKTLDGCTIYVTLEPCPMCAGAIYLSRVSRVVYGASDVEYGALGGKYDLLELSGFVARRPSVTGGVLSSECSALLRSFFASLRRGSP